MQSKGHTKNIIRSADVIILMKPGLTGLRLPDLDRSPDFDGVPGSVTGRSCSSLSWRKMRFGPQNEVSIIGETQRLDCEPLRASAGGTGDESRLRCTVGLVGLERGSVAYFTGLAWMASSVGTGLGPRGATSSPGTWICLWPQNEVSSSVRCGEEARRCRRGEASQRDVIESLAVRPGVGVGVGDAAFDVQPMGLVGRERGSVAYLIMNARMLVGEMGLLSGELLRLSPNQVLGFKSDGRREASLSSRSSSRSTSATAAA